MALKRPPPKGAGQGNQDSDAQASRTGRNAEESSAKTGGQPPSLSKPLPKPGSTPVSKPLPAGAKPLPSLNSKPVPAGAKPLPGAKPVPGSRPASSGAKPLGTSAPQPAGVGAKPVQGPSSTGVASGGAKPLPGSSSGAAGSPQLGTKLPESKPLPSLRSSAGAASKAIAGKGGPSETSGKNSDLMMVGAGKVQLSAGGNRAGVGTGSGNRPAPAGAAGRGIFGSSPVKKEEPAEKIEDTVLAQPWMRGIRPAPMFQDFLDRLVPKIALGQMTFGVLKAFSNIDERAEKVANCLRGNPYYEYHFLEVVDSLSKREQKPSTDNAVVLLGMQNSRDLTIAMQMMRTVFESHPEWREDGKIDLEPAETVKFARKTEEIFADDKELANIAYSAGLVFDLFMLLARRYSDDTKKSMPFIEHIYNHGLRSAYVGMALANTMPDFAFKRLVFPACLIHDIGKAAMAVMDLGYLQFHETALKRELTRQVRLYAEERRFGVSHNVLGSLICQFFETFTQIDKAILFHHEPFLLARRNKSLYQLASLVCLSSNIANHFRRPDRPDDPLIRLWKSRELDGFPLANQTLIEVANAVIKEHA